MEQIPDELKLHIFTYIKVLSPDLRPLLEINKEIRELLWYKKYSLNYYPWNINESIACISKSYLEYKKELIEQRREAEECIMPDTDEEIEEIEHYSYMNFPPF